MPELIERIEAAIEEDAQVHPVSGRPNRDPHRWAFAAAETGADQ